MLEARVDEHVGAVGVWQFTRGAARVFMTVSPAMDERLDPVAAARERGDEYLAGQLAHCYRYEGGGAAISV